MKAAAVVDILVFVNVLICDGNIEQLQVIPYKESLSNIFRLNTIENILSTFRILFGLSYTRCLIEVLVTQSNPTPANATIDSVEPRTIVVTLRRF
jgi:hypothetical protein